MRTLYILIISLVLFSAQSCVTNNGDIGPLYGEWSLDSYTIDNIDAPVNTDDYYWLFQGHIISIIRQLPHHEFITSIGSWECADEYLTINFTHTSAGGDADDTTFRAPIELGIPADTTMKLKILKLDSKHMSLENINEKGERQVYTLTKLK